MRNLVQRKRIIWGILAVLRWAGYMHGLRWFQRPRSKTTVRSHDYLEAKDNGAKSGPFMLAILSALLRGSVQSGLPVDPGSRGADDTVVLPARPHAARRSRRSRVPLAQQSGSEFPAAGRDGRPKRMVVQRRRRDEPFVRARERGPALVRDPVDIQYGPRRR